jgi:hypothetical protein
MLTLCSSSGHSHHRRSLDAIEVGSEVFMREIRRAFMTAGSVSGVCKQKIILPMFTQ